MIEAEVKDLQHRAQLALAKSPIYVLRELQVDQNGGTLLISGRVDTFYHKQLAQELVRAVASEIEVVNSIDVQ